MIFGNVAYEISHLTYQTLNMELFHQEFFGFTYLKEQ